MQRIETYPYEEVLRWTNKELHEREEACGEITTVIIPTLDEGTEKYREILKDIIKETARPVDSGAVNQVIIMD
ncbi:MAG: hypothetical protein JSV92_04835, partial [archaeon]